MANTNKFLDIEGLKYFWKKAQAKISNDNVNSINNVKGTITTSVGSTAGTFNITGTSGTSQIKVKDYTGADIVLTGYTKGTDSTAITAADKVNAALAKLENKIELVSEAEKKPKVTSINNITGAVTLESTEAGKINIKGTGTPSTVSINGWGDKANKADVISAISANPVTTTEATVSFSVNSTKGNTSAGSTASFTIPKATDTTAGVINLNDIKSKVGSVYNPKGSVKDLAGLTAIKSPNVGDVYNVEIDVTVDGKKYPSGTNFVFINTDGTGSAANEKNWDSLGGAVDLTNYALKEDYYTKGESDSKYALKNHTHTADKITGGTNNQVLLSNGTTGVWSDNLAGASYGRVKNGGVATITNGLITAVSKAANAEKANATIGTLTINISNCDTEGKLLPAESIIFNGNSPKTVTINAISGSDIDTLFQ